MTTSSVVIQDDKGNIYHPHTDANSIEYNGSSVSKALQELERFKNNGGKIGDTLNIDLISSALTDVIETNKRFLRLKNKTTNLLLSEQILHPDEDSIGKVLLGNIQFPFLDLYLKDLGSVKDAITVRNIALAKTNGCKDLGSGYAPLKGYRIGNMIHIQGVVAENTNRICINIEYESRPNSTLVIPCYYVNTQSVWASDVCTISTNGNITLPIATGRSCSLNITYFV